MKSVSKKIMNVMLVDDSAVVRQTLKTVLNDDVDINVVETCQGPYFAAQKLRHMTPDVMVLDVEMPRMDGITFLQKIMSQNPIPVIICTTMLESGSEATLKALEYGDVDIIQKPTIGTKRFLEESKVILTDVIKATAKVDINKLMTRTKQISPKLTADAILSNVGNKAMSKTTEKIIVIGASTGGTEAISSVLVAMPQDAPGVIIVQHMSAGDTKSFAKQLDEQCKIKVKEAQHGDSVLRGYALIAPGGCHTLLKRSGARYYVEVIDGPLVSRHRPSVDVLFRSIARYAGKNAVSEILTGMGADGAARMKEMHDTGTYTITQDEKTSVVYGMPAVAVKQGGLDAILPLNKITAALISDIPNVTQSKLAVGRM